MLIIYKILLFLFTVFLPLLLMHLYCYVILCFEGKIRKVNYEKEKQEKG